MGRHRHSRHHRSRGGYSLSGLHDLLDRIWGEPREICPKCKNERTEYYDPFFFAPLRTLSGKRRIRCPACGFIWRPSRSRRNIFDRLSP